MTIQIFHRKRKRDITEGKYQNRQYKMECKTIQNWRQVILTEILYTYYMNPLMRTEDILYVSQYQTWQVIQWDLFKYDFVPLIALDGNLSAIQFKRMHLYLQRFLLYLLDLLIFQVTCILDHFPDFALHRFYEWMTLQFNLVKPWKILGFIFKTSINMLQVSQNAEPTLQYNVNTCCSPLGNQQQNWFLSFMHTCGLPPALQPEDQTYLTLLSSILVLMKFDYVCFWIVSVLTATYSTTCQIFTCQILTVPSGQPVLDAYLVLGKLVSNKCHQANKTHISHLGLTMTNMKLCFQVSRRMKESLNVNFLFATNTTTLNDDEKARRT